ncbi:MAG TPA: SEFIR domain-containing protein [Candidatus Udaeobacter sp.]|nr:SEFIR domain-containing protein [Candidatus Udaeobacter sp.]
MAQVFLSYRHENDAHRERVRELGQRLRDADIDVVLDQFFLDLHPGGPDERWPRWSQRMAGETEKVLIIGSPGWFRCYEGKEQPGTGLGASAETVVINQRLYNVAGVTGAIRIAHFGSIDAASLPLDLQGFQHFDAAKDFSSICGWIKGVAAVASGGTVAPSAEWLVAPPVFEWLLADCQPVHDAFSKLLTATPPHRILLIRGGSETGKSHLTKWLLSLLVRHTSFACGRFDLGGATELDAEFSRFVQNLGVDEAVRASRGRPLRERLDEVLGALREAGQPAVLIFDTFEQGGEFQRWIEETLLLALPRAPWLRLIVAGQQVPQCDAQLVEVQRLDWRVWFEFGKRFKGTLTEATAQQIYEFAGGSHSLLGKLFGPAA